MKFHLPLFIKTVVTLVSTMGSVNLLLVFKREY